MALFGKSGQATVINQTLTESRDMETLETSQSLNLKEVEANIHQLVKKTILGKEKNDHLIQTQRNQLEQLQKEYKALDDNRASISGYLNSGSTKDPVVFKESAKKLEELNEQVTDKKRQIDRTELDILLLEQEKDEESINEMLQAWRSYEKEMFTNNISPVFKDVVAAKRLYFENLKKLRSHYINIERLAKQINGSLGDADKVTVHTWFDATLNSPELLITKHDEQKEEDITQTYRAE